jgi:hypothetical protein
VTAESSALVTEERGAAASPWQLILILAAACLLFLAGWTALHHGFLARGQLIDTPVYQAYGDQMVQGRVPYRDFSVEYPPGALGAFLLPAIGGGGHQDAGVYRRRFEWQMAFCGLVLLAAVAAALARLGATRARSLAVLGFVALAPVALGSVVLTRFDLLPAAIVAAAVAALVSGRSRLSLGLLGLGVAVKIYPLVLLPPALVWVWRRGGRREAAAAAQVFVAVVLLVFLPFVLIAPGGVAHSSWVQISRPLQIESLGSSLLVAGHDAFGLRLAVDSGSGSQNVIGTGSAVVATLTSLLQAAALIAIWAWFARGEASADRLLRAFAGSAVAFIVLGKVLSPQYLIWLLPLVPLVRGRRGLGAGTLLALALLATQGWFPQHYWQLVAFGGSESALLVLRNLVLLALLATLSWPARERGGATTERRTPLPTRTDVRYDRR